MHIDSPANKPTLRYFAWTLLLAVCLVPPAAWFAVALAAVEPAAGPSPNPSSAALTYLSCIVAVAVLWLIVARIIRRRSVRGVVSICALVSAGAAITALVSLLFGLGSLPARSRQWTYWEPTVVADQNAFVRARAHAYGSPINHSDRGDYVVRRSWRLDEYGVRPHNEALRARGVTWVLPWEEYGIPLRCFRSRYHFGWPRPDRTQILEWLPRILRDMAIEPIPFAINTTIYSMLLFVLVRGPRAVLWLRRALAGCCVHCGYRLTLNQVVCPECGQPVAPIDRLLLRSACDR